MPRVTFLPSGKSFEVVPRGSLLRAVLRARLPIARSCRGVGVCALCRVRIVAPLAGLEGDAEAGAGPLAPMGPVESQLAARAPLRPDERYACLARVVGDVAVTTSYW